MCAILCPQAFVKDACNEIRCHSTAIPHADFISNSQTVWQTSALYWQTYNITNNNGTTQRLNYEYFQLLIY